MRNYTEVTRVQVPAVVQFLRLGYQYQSKRDAVPDKETRIYIDRFASSIKRINKKEFTEAEISEILSDINRLIKNKDMGADFYNWLIRPQSKPKLIDFDNIDNNDFAVVTELTFGKDGQGDERKGSFRPDIVVLINGIPLAFLEVKPPNNTGGIQAEFTRMLDNRLENPDWRKYFNLLQFVTFSNNMPYEDSDVAMAAENIRAGSFYTTPNGKRTTFSFFRDEEPKTEGFSHVSDEVIARVLEDNEYRDAHSILSMAEFRTNLEKDTPCNSFVTSFFDKSRIMFFLRYGLVFVDEAVPQKHVMRYPQYFAAKNLIKRLDEGGSRGIVWHTQGSGKTELTVYLNRILKDYYSKKGCNTRFFYVVDRLDLLEQTSGRLSSRHVSVTKVRNKADFSKELSRSISISKDAQSDEECVVVNVHKFEDDVPKARNDYKADVVRVFFVDEAHRSYKQSGTYFQNLMLMDENAIFIALTGTPLLTKKERSNLKFGKYIHKYFYDKSIKDGYTLRIKREDIETTARTKIHANYLLENPDTSKDVVRNSPAYISSLCEYISEDFRGFRAQNLDKSVGGLIVCASNPQAQAIHKWFKDNSPLKTGLVISGDEEYSRDNVDVQRSFERSVDEYDLLVVHNMLTTGFDVSHLKKLYLLKNPKRQTLLQTLSRVNRPYRAPRTNVPYHYGYIVDFVDIEKEYDRTLQDYMRELSEVNDDADFKGLIVDVESINRNLTSYLEELENYGGVENLELFSQNLVKQELPELYSLRRTLNDIISCRVEFLLAHADDYASKINEPAIKAAINEVSKRISLLNLKISPADTLGLISDNEVADIVYSFVKTRVSVLDISEYIDKIVDVTKRVKHSIAKVQNQRDSRLIRLNEALAEIFAKLKIVSLEDAKDLYEQLESMFGQIETINLENSRLAEKYGGNYAFVKTYQDCLEQHPDVAPEVIEGLVSRAYNCVNVVMKTNPHQLESRNGFINTLTSKFADYVYDKPELVKVNAQKWYKDDILKNAYDNMRIFA